MLITLVRNAHLRFARRTTSARPPTPSQTPFPPILETVPYDVILLSMSSTPYAEAHHRVLIRQQQRDAALQAEAQTRRQQHLSTRVGQLPFPLGNLGRGGLEVWQSIKGREGTGPAFRVGQLDSELLDEELLELLKAQAGEGLKYFGVCCSIHSNLSYNLRVC